MGGLTPPTESAYKNLSEQQRNGVRKMSELIGKIMVVVAMACATLLTGFVVGATTLLDLNPALYLCVVPYAMAWFILWLES
jgi:hypothetical protein